MRRERERERVRKGETESEIPGRKDKDTKEEICPPFCTGRICQERESEEIDPLLNGVTRSR